MTDVLLAGGRVVLPDSVENGCDVLVKAGHIAAVGPSLDCDDQVTVMDVDGKTITPGWIDLHVHGGANADFMDGTPEAVEQTCRAHLKHGTTTIFPTTTTGSPEQMHAMLDACSRAHGKTDLPEIGGVHLYGPFFAEDKVGCHSKAGRRSPTAAEYETYFDSGIVRIATCAAELDGAAEFYQLAREHNCLVTCGHSNASWPEMQAAFDCGVRHVDHFWCAMSSVPSLRSRFGTPMQASMAEFVLMQTEMSTEVIADGYHLSKELLEFAYRMIGPERLCLVTDCNRALDMPAGEYRFGNKQDGSWFKSDEQVGWALDGGSLASSVKGMDHMVRTMHAQTSAPLQDIIRMASLTPATRSEIADRKGSIEVGKDADLLILNDALELEQVILRGTPRPTHS